MGREIGRGFREILIGRRINRSKFAERLGFRYTDNERMLCAYFVKEDRLWRQSEVQAWCRVLGLGESSAIYSKFMEKAGKKDVDG